MSTAVPNVATVLKKRSSRSPARNTQRDEDLARGVPAGVRRRPGSR